MELKVTHAPGCTGCCDQGEQSHWEVIHCQCCRAVRGEQPGPHSWDGPQRLEGRSA